MVMEEIKFPEYIIINYETAPEFIDEICKHYDWLAHIGATKEGLKTNKEKLFIKAEISEHKKIHFIAIGVPTTCAGV